MVFVSLVVLVRVELDLYNSDYEFSLRTPIWHLFLRIEI